MFNEYSFFVIIQDDTVRYLSRYLKSFLLILCRGNLFTIALQFLISYFNGKFDNLKNGLQMTKF